MTKPSSSAASGADGANTASPTAVPREGVGLDRSPGQVVLKKTLPGRMAGAAGGAPQTVQRIGAALGSAVAVTLYYHELRHTQGGFGRPSRTPCSTPRDAWSWPWPWLSRN